MLEITTDDLLKQPRKVAQLSSIPVDTTKQVEPESYIPFGMDSNSSSIEENIEQLRVNQNMCNTTDKLYTEYQRTALLRFIVSKALTYFSKLLHINPESLLLCNHLSVVLCKQGYYKETIKGYKYVISQCSADLDHNHLCEKATERLHSALQIVTKQHGDSNRTNSQFKTDGNTMLKPT